MLFVIDIFKKKKDTIFVINFENNNWEENKWLMQL